MRWLKRILLTLAGLTLVTLLTAWLLVRRQLPDAAVAPVNGLKGEVTVALDSRGVPTIKAATLLDAFRVQGFETARERLFQMELMRRSAEGRLCELVGAGALPLDKLHRTYGFKQVAEAAVPLLPKEERDALQAYADGVNAYLASHPGRWGVEFQMLGLKPEPWTPAHSLEVMLLMQEDLSTSWKSEVQAEALKDLPEATRKFLMPVIAEGDLPLTPDAPGTVPDTAAFFQGERGEAIQRHGQGRRPTEPRRHAGHSHAGSRTPRGLQQLGHRWLPHGFRQAHPCQRSPPQPGRAGHLVPGALRDRWPLRPGRGAAGPAGPRHWPQRRHRLGLHQPGHGCPGPLPGEGDRHPYGARLREGQGARGLRRAPRRPRSPGAAGPVPEVDRPGSGPPAHAHDGVHGSQGLGRLQRRRGPVHRARPEHRLCGYGGPHRLPRRG
ncbi:MAG: penicillin acylase family protein [Holophagaceae bacterium]|nr:penicillin acylase family protein [Holophagaceae bacterium]